MIKQIQLIPKDIIIPRAIVLDKEHKELYGEAVAKTAEQFGKDSQAYKTITGGIDTANVTGSQFFWNTNLNQYLSNNQRVVNLSDMEKINDIDETFFTGFYSDTPQIILRSENASWNQNKYVLKNLVNQVKNRGHMFSSGYPLIISNLELIKNNSSQNKYGLLLKINDKTTMKNDKRFAYLNDMQKIQFGKKTKTIYTKENGLSGVFLGGDGDLDSGGDIRTNSGDCGRVVIVSNESHILRLKTPQLNF
ncbi:hypothetical protein KAT80_03350 [Candidatus Pacearchaeota archaeon]|nr:hypothetical protein [Candidatus Pacearchaeota archaeon]